MANPTTLRVALEWTPNTIHTGLFLAQAKGFYSAAGLNVVLSPPDASSNKGPSGRLEAGEVDLAVCPSESCIMWAESGKMHLQAVYAILQRDASAIVSTTLQRPRELGEGRVYASYDARYEVAIVKTVIEKDGGNGEGVKIKRPEGNVSMFEAVKKGEIDATWVFVPWEGVEAEMEGKNVSYFRMEDYGITYGYSHVIARKVGDGGLDEDVLRRFVKATREGYEAAMKDVRAAVEAIRPHCKPERSEEMLLRSQARINEFYADGGQPVGTMSGEKWKTWIAWLEEQKIMKPNAVEVEKLFTNEFHS
ncbi:hypothetical protein Q7P37_003176 [Cladosporium fusiforme]